MKKVVPKEISKKYKLPKELTDFQLSLYIHLIEWKWKNLTKEPGLSGKYEYDAILPKKFKDELQPIYRPVVDEIRQNHQFKKHIYFGHMASSQAACINLFYPILRDEKVANFVLPKINPRFAILAKDKLENGLKFEYYDISNPLNDHSANAGTDSDVAIAYYDTNHDLSLWLIEHKLTENEFTTCGGYKSSNNKTKELCRSSTEIVNNHTKCYYQYNKNYKYWEITETSKLFNSDALKANKRCPFISGTNQLWRNQLMAYSVQKNGLFKNVHFSVVHHPDNHDLQKTIDNYTDMLLDKSLFSVFTSKQILDNCTKVENKEIREWVRWYSDLYRIN
jgi:hypothetical protein